MASVALQRAWALRSRLRSCVLTGDRLRQVSPQLSLFSTKSPQQLREEKLLVAMDRIRDRFGHSSVHFGSVDGEPGRC
jgi:hypothetical protein